MNFRFGHGRWHRCFDRRCLDMGHVELQRGHQVDIRFGRRFDGVRRGRLGQFVDQRELGRGLARYPRLLIVRRRQVRRRSDRLPRGFGGWNCIHRCRRRNRRRVDQRELGRGFARHCRLFVIRQRCVRGRRDRPLCGFGDRRRRRRRDQRDQPDIRAAADALQHHAADADRSFHAALLQRVAARRIEAGLGEIAKAEQGTRGVAGADEHAVARKGGDR